MSGLWRAWEAFWFHATDLYAVSLMRCLLAGTWLVMYGIRFSDFDILFSDQGIMPGHFAPDFLPAHLQSVFPFYFIDEGLAYWSHGLFLVLLLGLFLGLFGRSLTWLVFVLHVGFMQRNPGLVYGADLFSAFWLFGLSFIQHNRYFSLWNLRRKNAFEAIELPRLESDWASTIGIRLIQVQLALSYAFTGVEKLKGETWWEGTAVWHVLVMKDLLAADYSFLYNFPLLVAALTMGTVVFEVYFPAAVLSHRMRPWWLLVGFFFHLSTAIFMNLPFFCLVMVLPYLLFIEPKSLHLGLHRLRDLVRERLPLSSQQA